MSNCDLAEHVEQAMRDNGQLPQWKRTTSPAAPVLEELVLSLDCGVRVVAQDFGDWPLLITTIPQPSTKGGLLDLARKAPAHLAPVLAEAAAELKQIAEAEAVPQTT